MLDHGDHPLLFREQGEVAGIRDHREFGVGDAPEGFQRVLKPDKIVITESNDLTSRLKMYTTRG
jgi:hypothetical protein